MAKYTGPDCRLCRREGVKLNLKGDKCISSKCPFDRRPVAPGQHKDNVRRKASSYSVQLREKQKTKRIYGLCEKQFRGYFDKAEVMRGVTGTNMLVLLERRLDNVVFRLSFAPSRAMARQLVNHGHFTVNGKCVNIPSYLVKKGDVIAVKENKASKAVFADIKAAKTLALPKWLEFDNEKLTGRVLEMPERSDASELIEEHLIVELYSK